MTKVMVVGARGQMGRRYCAILRHLEIPLFEVELGDDEAPPPGITHIIIATPTATHCDQIRLYSEMELPVLCEKPIATDTGQVYRLIEFCEEKGVKLRCVNQYKYVIFGDEMVDGDEAGALEEIGAATEYDYVNTGKDGKYWDCISIIALATGGVSIKNESPIWTCRINGDEKYLDRMDHAYIAMVKDFIENPPTTPETDYIFNAHTKVDRMIKRENTNRNSSAIGIDASAGKML